MGIIELPNGPIDPNVLKAKTSQLTGEQRWKDIEDLVMRWTRKNPVEAGWTKAYIKDVQAGLKDKKFGLVGGTDHDDTNQPNTRIGIAIHPSLMNYIQAFYPEFLDTNEDLQEMKKRFPQFRVPEY